MTEPTNEPSASVSKGIVISRNALVVGVAVLVVLLVGAAVLISILIASSGGSAPEAGTKAPEKASVPSASAPVQPAPAPEPQMEVYSIGETFTTGNVTLTIHSVEVLDSVATTSGSPLTPDPGGQLVLFRTTYSNSKTQADLSCGNTDLYVQVFDSQEREMAPVFENPRIPGNPGCNDHLLQGVAHEWNFVFQSVAGAVPLAMSVTETDKWLDPVWVDLQ